MKVFEALEQMKQNGPAAPLYGICSNLDSVSGFNQVGHIWRENQDVCFRSWDEFSGNDSYPVPSDNPRRGPQLAFDYASEESMWSMEQPYGQSRWRLLDHCINWFKEKDL